MSRGGAAITELMRFLDSSPTAFQATSQALGLFDAAGFGRLNEGESWSLEPGKGYFVVRNASTVIAFRMGSEAPEESGLRIVTAHTDSPALKIKSRSETVKDSVLSLSVEVYGGPIYNTWLDRELSIAGSVTIRDGGKPVRRLFRGDDPIAIIPNVAIHLNREVNKGFAFNPQDHLKAVFSATASGDGPFLPVYLADRLNVDPDAVLDYDLYLCDRRAAALAGLQGDLLVSGRLDNLAMCHAAIDALVHANGARHTQLAVLFDSEEIGSRTFQGAAGAFLRDVVERVAFSSSGAGVDSAYRALARSAMISGDAAHGFHPSYAEKHDEHYKPRLNGGPVIKISAGQRYTTTAHTASVFEHICADCSVPVQRIISRSDLSSGGTVGPGVSSDLGIPSLDIGHPVWAMHSIRETGGADDHQWMIGAVRGFFESDLSWVSAILKYKH